MFEIPTDLHDAHVNLYHCYQQYFEQQAFYDHIEHVYQLY